MLVKWNHLFAIYIGIYMLKSNSGGGFESMMGEDKDLQQ